MTPEKCKFCRSEVEVLNRSEIWESPLFYVACLRKRCYMTGPNRTTKETAVKAWNRIEVRK